VGGQDDPGDPGAGPRLLLLGPVRLWGAAGPRPPKAERSCLEYLAWLLEHPGATAATMARGLCVAEGTRRSNLSRLRAWLGPAADGRPHLPAAYSGQLHLHPGVASDWRHCQLLLQPWGGPGWTGRLVAALGLVRGRPLADVGRGQWTWAEPLRAAMADTLRPAALELSHRALALDDIAAARWAVDRGRAALPEDEALRRQSRRVDRRGGDRLPVNRLTTGLGGRPTPTARPPVAARRLVCPRPAAA
jgi:hypothetical protein